MRRSGRASSFSGEIIYAIYYVAYNASPGYYQNISSIVMRRVFSNCSIHQTFNMPRGAIKSQGIKLR